VKNIVSFIVAMLILTTIMQSFSIIRFSNANPETILYVSPPKITVLSGDIFSVNVSIQDVFVLHAFHLFLGYNTTVLDALSVYICPPFNNGPILFPIIDDESYVEFSGSAGIPGLGVSGSFPLAKITFNATALGKSKLDLYNTDLWDSMSNPIAHSVVDGEVTIYPRIACSDFVLEIIEAQCEISRESGVTYFKLPTWSLFGPNTPVYDNARQAVWMTSTNITYGDSGGAIETFNGNMIMLNVNDGSALLYEFPLDVGGGFKGLGPFSCTLDDDGNLWMAIEECFWVPEELPESIPSLAKLCPDNSTLTVFWLPKEFGWVNDVKLYDGYIWCLSDKYLIKMSGGDLEGFWKNFRHFILWLLVSGWRLCMDYKIRR